MYIITVETSKPIAEESAITHTLCVSEIIKRGGAVGGAGGLDGYYFNARGNSA